MNTSNNNKPVGRIVGLWRYPVKSMGAEALAEVDVAWHGLAGDRRWAFIKNGVPHNGFPWLTLRDRNNMGHYKPTMVQPARPDRSPLNVETPTGTVYSLTDTALAQELYPDGVQLIKQDQGIFDRFPLSLITTQTISQLSKEVGFSLDAQRFRPNFLVETFDQAAFPEDSWLGYTLRIGSMRMRVDNRDSRCIAITIDPETSERNPVVLRTVAKQRQGCLGVYGTPVKPGCIALNDEVFIEAIY